MTSNKKNSALKISLLSLAMGVIMAAVATSATAADNANRAAIKKTASASNNGSAKNNYLLPNGAGNGLGAPFILISPTLTIGGVGFGGGVGISAGLDFGDETHAGNIDFHYLPISAVAINNLLKDISKAYNNPLPLNVPSHVALHLLSIPVTYDYTAKFGGKLKFLIGTGIGLDLLLLYQNINLLPENTNTGVVQVDDVASKVAKTTSLKVPMIPELLLTPRIGVEWNVIDWLTVSANLRGFIDLPIYYFSRATLDASVKMTF